MAAASYSEIRDRLGRQLDDLSSAEARVALIDRLAELIFEVDRLKDHRRTLLAALRSRDVLVRENGQAGAVAPSGLLELDSRDALDTSGGFYDIEWRKETAFRWTGPGRDSLVHVWLDRSVAARLEIVLFSYGDPRNRGALSLTVDGTPVALRETSELTLRSEPFPCLDASLVTEVGLHVPFLTNDTGDATTTPARGGKRGAKAGASARRSAVEEGRSRGIAIAHLRFFPAT